MKITALSFNEFADIVEDNGMPVPTRETASINVWVLQSNSSKAVLIQTALGESLIIEDLQ